MESKRSSLAPALIAVALFVPIAYVGSYLAMVQPDGVVAQNHRGWYDVYYYRFGGEASETIFWPLESLDRKSRPKYWQNPFSDVRPDDN
jgi:hypothetical protein